MERQEFIKTLGKMVEFYSSQENVLPAGYIESAVERWAKVHPVKTRQTEFLKLYPNAQKDAEGLINICPRKLQETFSCEPYNDCNECLKSYWSKEIE